MQTRCLTNGNYAMNGIDFVADTNFLINVHNGNPITEPFLDDMPAVSVITKIELLGWQTASPAELRKLKSLLDACFIIQLTPEIVDMTIKIRQNFAIKTPDAIIAATAKVLQLPLVTSDKEFKKLTDVPVILI